MKSTWRKHIIICLLLGLLAVPIYFLDLAFTEGGGGNWITLDFRGFIIWTYVTLVAIEVAVSSIAVWLFPKAGALAFTRLNRGFPDPPCRRRRRLRKSVGPFISNGTANFDGEAEMLQSMSLN